MIGIDADARTMAERSRRAATTPAKGGHPNATFLVSGVELLPRELDGIADRVTVRFPWGSLLRGAIGTDPAVSASIARLVGPDGVLELAVSIVEHDRLVARDPGEPTTADAATPTAAASTDERRPATWHSPGWAGRSTRATWSGSGPLSATSGSASSTSSR